MIAVAADGGSLTGRYSLLCCGRFVRQVGDMPLEEWTAKETDGTIPSGDYVVTAILDERRRPRGCTDEFIVKWKASILACLACACLGSDPVPHATQLPQIAFSLCT